MSNNRKKFPNLNPNVSPTFFVSEPRYIKARRSVRINKFSITDAAGQEADLHVDEQISNPIYEIEITNADAMTKRKKK